MYTKEPKYNKEMIIAKKLFKLPRHSEKLKIYNSKINHIIAINGLAYNRLLCDNYIHWREERLLVPLFNEIPILRKSLSFVFNKIWDIIAEKSFLTKIDKKTKVVYIKHLNKHILTITKIATSFVNHYKLTPQTSLPQLSNYAEELANKLLDSKTKKQAQKARDQAKRCFQELELSKEQANTLIPIRALEKHVDEKDPIKIIA
ncbi:11383_t:CDS:2 [Scutellospora calospora]|uniref:11383_t:CDS:1 n=1 Tax=Scutellospora calospora TaxID=85575 RepID=A0ACA9K3G6_9GLOM|nr:11383_t:CDS:2 [Scutellospora calospora]